MSEVLLAILLAVFVLALPALLFELLPVLIRRGPSRPELTPIAPQLNLAAVAAGRAEGTIRGVPVALSVERSRAALSVQMTGRFPQGFEGSWYRGAGSGSMIMQREGRGHRTPLLALLDEETRPQLNALSGQVHSVDIRGGRLVITGFWRTRALTRVAFAPRVSAFPPRRRRGVSVDSSRRVCRRTSSWPRRI
jgi:hypothetical protein